MDENAEEGNQQAARGRRSPWRRRLRWTAVVVLLVLTGVLAAASVAARTVHATVLDTDGYVETVAPLSADPAVRAALADRVTDEIVTRIDIEAIVAQALTEVAGTGERRERAIAGLSPVLADQAKDFVHETVTTLVESDEFDDLWAGTNRAAHRQVVAVVTGQTRSVEIDDAGTISVSLAPIIDRAKERLLARGFVFADRVPRVEAQFVLVQSAELATARRVVDALDRAASVLPWLALLTAVAAIALAPKGFRLRTTIALGLTYAAVMAMLALALRLARAYYLDHRGPAIRSPDAAAAVVDILTRPLWHTVWVVFALGLIIAAAAYLASGASSARAVRRAVWRR
ncbi:hypothetical protein [Nocardia cyriacigeorgica]|uniref:hypothetical protein n=1 Tax=Nocardia cyriacigeorgica TaxID=135487 RepID=UPI000CEA4D92|nr:hypothetical protein [Nocardia cyriacigeorgica]AVH23500.1 hypothetical protein C5B73_20785 [Nocardia cyriacigeorgica]MBF6323079.1 hypothetical protein [Nocardia cyriacigeorgica]PPJ15530.1 hypothetical protein C5E43_04950 [Nocardia cyriacigeorgica]